MPKVLEALRVSSDPLASKTRLSTIDSAISSEYSHIQRPHVASYHKFNEIKDRLHGISSLKFRLSQIVFLLQTENASDVSVSIGRLRNQLTVLNRPERVNNVTAFESITLGVRKEGATRLLLNPWSFSVETSLFWESWQRHDSKPQLQVSIDSDSVMIDLSPDLIKTVRLAAKDLGEYFANVRAEEEEAALPSEMLNERESPVDRVSIGKY